MATHQYFPDQKADEKVLLLVRPHWLVMLRAILAFVFLFVMPIIAVVAASGADLGPLGGTGLALTVTLVPAFYLMLFTWFFIRWLDYYLDVGIVTDQRIVDIDQRGLFQRNVAELDSKMVQDVASDKSGVLQTIFDFGDVIVQTAGERPNFTFKAVPHPEMMVDKIQQAIGSRTEESGDAAEKLAEAAEEMKTAAELHQEAAQNPEPKPTPAAKPAPTPAEPAAAPANRDEAEQEAARRRAEAAAKQVSQKPPDDQLDDLPVEHE